MSARSQALVPLSTEQQAAWRAVAETDKRPRIRIFSQRVTLMAAFFGLRHRPPCGLLLSAERNQCL